MALQNLVWCTTAPPLNDPAGVPRESFENERRVALTPAGVASLKKAGFKEVGAVQTQAAWPAQSAGQTRRSRELQVMADITAGHQAF